MIKLIKPLTIAILTFSLAAMADDTTSVSPSFNSKSIMSGALSNVQVNNMIQGQRQRIGSTDCQSGWTFTAGVNIADNESDPFNYHSNNTMAQLSVGTTLFDKNESTCHNAMKASLYRLNTQSATDLFKFCGQLYATLKDRNAPKFDLERIRYSNTPLGDRINTCLNMVHADETFRTAPPIIKQVISEGVKAVAVNKAKVPTPSSYRVHYGNFKTCQSCLDTMRKKIEHATGVSADRIKLIEFYSRSGEPKLSINVVGFNTELAALNFANINKKKINFSKVSGVYRWTHYARSPWSE